MISCKYGKFGAISLKIDILSKFESKNCFLHITVIHLPQRKFRFYLVDFQLNTDFPSQFWAQVSEQNHPAFILRYRFLKNVL